MTFDFPAALMLASLLASGPLLNVPHFLAFGKEKCFSRPSGMLRPAVQTGSLTASSSDSSRPLPRGTQLYSVSGKRALGLTASLGDDVDPPSLSLPCRGRLLCGCDSPAIKLRSVPCRYKHSHKNEREREKKKECVKGGSGPISSAAKTRAEFCTGATGSRYFAELWTVA